MLVNKKKYGNLEKVHQTLDTKMFNKNNSLSLVVPSKIAKDIKHTIGGKKSPGYGKRNLSMSNNRTYDERNNKFDTIDPLDFNARMNLLGNSNMAKYEGLRNHRYKLNALMDQKRKSGSSRKKSSNSKKRAQKKIASHYRNKFHITPKVF